MWDGCRKFVVIIELAIDRKRIREGLKKIRGNCLLIDIFFED